MNKLSEINNDEIQFTINDQLFLETLLMEIRGKTISYASYKAKCKRSEETTILQEIDILEKNLSDENKDRLENLHTELML